MTNSSRLRVLYIEDNALVREITCDLLADEAREIVAVSTGEEGLCAFEESPFDIVVTDVSLPAMSGFELVRRVKQLAPSTPVILASGYPLDIEEFSLGSKVRTLTKPFDGPELEALIADLCGSAAKAPVAGSGTPG
jgi:two-component system, cell cycle response regulator CpdR